VQLTLDLGEGSSRDVGLREDEQVEGRTRQRRGEPPEALAEETLRTVANDRVPDLAADRQTEPIARRPVRSDQEREQPSVEPCAASEHPVELRSGTQALRRSEARAHPSRPLAGLSRSGREALAALLTAPLQDELPALRAHPHEEAVRALALAIVRLERPLHGDPLVRAAGSSAGSQDKL
jgi:hypothetical protein